MALQRFLKLFQVLSFDVVAGALALGLYAVTLLHDRPSKAWWLVLAFAVWVVYSTDHLLDSFSMKNKAAIFRHRFHFKYRIRFVAAILLFSLLSVSMAYRFLNKNVLYFGWIIGIAAVLYFVMVYVGRQKRIYFQKELFISIFYVAGIWLAPLANYPYPLQPFVVMIISGFVLLAWAEGIIVAISDGEKDKADGHPSFVTHYGMHAGGKMVAVLLGLHFLLMIFALLFTEKQLEVKASLIQLAMNLSLLTLFTKNKRQQNRPFTKLLGEMVFWLPALLYFG